MRKLFQTTVLHIFLITVLLVISTGAFAQTQGWGNEGELEDVEIEIVKERQIVLPKVNRNFEKIPPRPADPNSTPVIKYDFKPFNFQAPQISPALRPLKLKQENPSNVYGGYVSAGYGNYASPYLEGFINSRKDKNKLYGAHAFVRSSDKGPVDGRNSGSGTSGISVYGKTFNEYISLSGDVGFENRTTHFYGYPTGFEVSSPKDIKQSFNQFNISGEISNAKKTDFSYQLGAGFSHLMDKYEAKETEVDLDFNSTYKIADERGLGIKAGYYLINRKDALVDAKARSLFFVNPRYEFKPLEELKISAGFNLAFENDSIDKNVHVYPDIRASYPLSPSVEAIASLTGGIEKVSLKSLSNENLWVAPNIPIFHTNKIYDLQAALNAKIANKVSVTGGLSFAALKNWYFFTNQISDQSKFTPVYDQGATVRTNLFASVGFAHAESAKFLLRGDFYAYGTDEVAEAWHRPTYKFTGSASFNIVQKVLLDVNVIAQGGMKALEPTTLKTVKLAGAFDLNARAEYLFSKSFSFFIDCNNITSNKYPVFLYYPVRGFQVLGGITWSF